MGVFDIKKNLMYAAIVIAVIGSLILIPLLERDQNRFTETEIAWMETQKDEILYMGYYPSLSEKWFSKKLAEEFSKDTGLNFQLYEGTWTETLQKLKAGEIALCSNLNYSEERSKFVIYTSSFEGIDAGVYSKMEQNIDSVEELKGKKIGILKGSFLTQMFDAHYPRVKFSYFYYDTNEQLSQALSKDEIHGIITTKNYNSNMREFFYYNIPTLKLDNNFVGIYKENHELASIIKKEVDYLRENNWSKYIKKAIDYELEKENVPFNEDELAYIHTHQALTIGVPKDFYYEPLFQTVISRVELISDLNLNIEVDSYNSLLENDEVDIMITYGKKFDKLTYSVPLLFDRSIIIGDKESQGISSQYDLETYHVGIHKDAMYGKSLYEEMPFLTLENESDIHKLANKIEKGSIDYILLPERVGHKLMEQDRGLSLKGKLDEKVYYIGLKQKNEQMLSILNKSVLKIDMETLVEEEADLYFAENKESFQYESYILVMIGLIILGVLLAPIAIIQRTKIKNILYINDQTKLENLFWFDRNMKKFEKNHDFYLMKIKNIDTIYKYYDSATYKNLSRKILTILKKQLHEKGKIIYVERDKYLIIRPHTNEEEKESFARDLLNLFNEKLFLFDIEYSFEGMVGYLGQKQVISDFDWLMKALDKALYYSEQQKKCIEYTLEIENRFEYSINSEKEIIESVINENITIVYEAVYSKDKSNLFALNSNLRCRSEKGDFINQKSFFEGVKKFNLELDVDRIRITKIVEMIKEYEARGEVVNILSDISDDILKEENFAIWIDELLGKCKSKVIFKITSDQLDHNFDRIVELYSDQISFAINNFGEDLSNIAEYSEMMIDLLVLDQQYLLNLNEGHVYEDVFDFVMDTGKKLGKPILVTDIKTESQLNLIERKDVDYFCGPIFNK